MTTQNPIRQDMTKLAISMIDLTSLTDKETSEDIKKLCQKAKSNEGNTAAICIFPRYIPLAKKILLEQGTPDIKIATVTNFPDGNEDITIAVSETKAAIAYGADEVDVVYPYKALINGDINIGFELVEACKQVCPQNVLLKVIIESGELKTPALIKLASEVSIRAGADFIKTSTGKVKVNATPLAAEIMLKVIKSTNNGHIDTGLKIAGGVKDIDDVQLYLNLAKSILGDSWVEMSHFRFGASKLLDNLLITLDHTGKANHSSIGY